MGPWGIAAPPRPRTARKRPRPSGELTKSSSRISAVLGIRVVHLTWGQDKRGFCRSAAIYHNYDIIMALLWESMALLKQKKLFSFFGVSDSLCKAPRFSTELPQQRCRQK